MKIVVTGALGHIGSRLIRSLPDAFPGGEFVLVDSLATQRYASVFSLPHAQYRLVELDVVKGELDPLVEGAAAVIHLAALTDAGASALNPLDMERVNYAATSRMASACAAARCALLHVSSTSVYGASADDVDEDSAEYLNPQSPYAGSKLKEERLLAEMGAGAGLRFAVLRFGTICGVSAGMRFHTAVNRFCWQAATGQPLTVWRTAMEQRRPYLDLSEAIAAITFVLQRDLFERHVYNVVTDNLTVASILEMIKLHRPDVRVQLVDSPIMNDLSYSVVNRKLRQAGFGFRGDVAACVADTLRILKSLHAS
jgi:nucleoside-diphosphate-sugar epimerase